MNEIIWLLTFSVWLILLSIIFSRSNHVVTNGSISPCLVAEWHCIVCIHCIFFFKKYVYWLCYYSCPISPHSLHFILPTPPPTSPPYSSCPWVIHVSSLASTFPILFLPSPCLFSTYHLCYLFSVPFPPLSPSHSPMYNPPCDLHFCGSVPF